MHSQFHGYVRTLAESQTRPWPCDPFPPIAFTHSRRRSPALRTIFKRSGVCGQFYHTAKWQKIWWHGKWTGPISIMLSIACRPDCVLLLILCSKCICASVRWLGDIYIVVVKQKVHFRLSQHFVRVAPCPGPLQVVGCRLLLQTQNLLWANNITQSFGRMADSNGFEASCVGNDRVGPRGLTQQWQVTFLAIILTCGYVFGP